MVSLSAIFLCMTAHMMFSPTCTVDSSHSKYTSNNKIAKYDTNIIIYNYHTDMCKSTTNRIIIY